MVPVVDSSSRRGKGGWLDPLFLDDFDCFDALLWTVCDVCIMLFPLLLFTDLCFFINAPTFTMLLLIDDGTFISRILPMDVMVDIFFPDAFFFLGGCLLSVVTGVLDFNVIFLFFELNIGVFSCVVFLLLIPFI